MGTAKVLLRTIQCALPALFAAAVLGACGETKSRTKASLGEAGDSSFEEGGGGSDDDPPGSGTGASGGRGGAAGAGGSTAGSPSRGGATGRGGSSAGGGSSAQGGATGGVVSAPFFQRIRLEAPPKLDVLFMIDNSRKMGPKQALLAEAIPAFLERLSPVRDIHLGVVSSSLGDMGSSDACASGALEKDDRGELMGKVRRSLPSWDEQGFLAWDPEQSADPPGAAELDELATAFVDHVNAVGESGCGYEASLEAWYRFLIDPEPPESVARDASMLSSRSFPNEALLAQRKAFLRPDSVVAIVMLTDENDCSIIDYGQGWIVGLQAGGTFTMPRATSACNTDPNSECCFNCSHPTASVPTGCVPPEADAECSKGELNAAEDHPNLRCYQQKRRFGFDMLQPISKYIEALTQPRIRMLHRPDVSGDEIVDDQDRVKNPLFGAGVFATDRDPSMVFLAGIVGVPWQDVSDEADWNDERTLRFLSHGELVERGRWDWMLGALPDDSLMFETPVDRTALPVPQEHPAGFGSLAASNTTEQDANPINGHETNIQDGSDLQAACIFPLRAPIDCSTAETCECNFDEEGFNRAVCDGTVQTHSAAYPSVRVLEVLKGFGDITGNSVVASICPKLNEVPESNERVAGYVPALDALAARMQRALAGECLAEDLPTDAEGRTACSVLEILLPERNRCQPCAEIPGRKDPDFDIGKLAPFLEPRACFCEVEQFEGDALTSCRTGIAAPDEPGFCYVDADADPGEASDSEALETRRELVAGCPEASRRILRFGPEPPRAFAPQVYLACEDL